MNASKYKDLDTIIRENEFFVLISHVNTDADALGSLIALQTYLRKRGKRAEAVVPGHIPERYHFLGTEHLINSYDEDLTGSIIQQCDVVVILDISALQRLDKWYKPVLQSPALKVCIDHHPGEFDEVDLMISEPQRVSTAEIIYDYFKYADQQPDALQARALYAGVLSDSGGFRFSGTASSTLRTASELAEYGADPVEIYSSLYETGSWKQLQAWGALLAELRHRSSISWVEITRSFLDSRQLALEDIDGLVDVMRKDGSSNAFVVFIEKEKNEILVGLRSRGDLDVGLIARKFGGGGHFHAAGFTGQSSLAETAEQVIAEINESQNSMEINIYDPISDRR